MADSELQVRITARDEASASIETAGRNMEALATFGGTSPSFAFGVLVAAQKKVV